MCFPALGLREGWLFEQLSDEQRAIDPLIDAARSFGRPNARVPEFDDALIRWTDKLFRNEGQADRRLRWAACMLSDIAWADHRDVQARMCFDRLLRFPFITVDHADRAFLATAVHARYSGDTDAPELETAKRLLITAWQSWVRQLDEELGPKAGPRSIVAPRSWLLRTGWHKHGPLPFEATPGRSRAGKNRSRR